MNVIKTIQPNENGAKRFQREWGEKLVAVRYREDSSENQIYTTIEIIVDQREKPNHKICNRRLLSFKRSQIVAIRVEFEELEIRDKLKKYRARWSKNQKLWLTTYSNVVAMGLAERIIPGGAEKCTDVDMYIYDHYG